MVWVRHWWLLCVPVLLGVSSCSGHYRELLEQNEALRRDISGMRASQANLTVLMEDLQNKILLLEDQVETTRLIASRSHTDQQNLPVVRLTPGGAPDRNVPEEVPDDESDRQFTMEEVPEVTFYRLEGGKVIKDDGASSSTATQEPPAETARTTRAPFDSRPIEIYKKGYDLLVAKKHDLAIETFQGFLEAYPNHDYADNALYWMGEAYYDRQDFSNALQCFERLVRLYPDGNKVPDAMLKRGLSLYNLGRTDEANRVMDELTKLYPATAAAGIARDKRKDMR